MRRCPILAGLIYFLILVLVLVVVVYVVHLVVGMLELPPNVRQIALILIGLIALIVLIVGALQIFGPLPPLRA